MARCTAPVRGHRTQRARQRSAPHAVAAIADTPRTRPTPRPTPSQGTAGPAAAQGRAGREHDSKPVQVLERIEEVHAAVAGLIRRFDNNTAHRRWLWMSTPQ